MKKRDTNIKQHYVPQLYLRNFTNDRGKLHVYDILRDNHFVTSPAKECYEEYFYDIDTAIFKLFTDSEENYEELVDDRIRLLNEEVSSILLNFLNTVKSIKVNFQFEREDRNKLYNFIVLQVIRTPFYRERLSYLNVPFCIKAGLSGDLGDEKTQDLIHNLLILGVLNKLHDTEFHLNKLYFTIFEHLINEILDLKRQLEKSGKLFLVNKTSCEFICSSSPVNVLWKDNMLASHKALVTTFDDKKLFDIGDYLEFQTIHLPISSDVAIFLFDKNYSQNLTAMNQGIGLIQDWNSDLLLNLNYSTMLKNGHKIYSASGDYSKMIQMRKERINPMMNFRFGDE
jgi:hypothetical protein